MEKYIHNILEDDGPDTIECKEEYNEALINKTEVQILHETMELENNPITEIIETKIDADNLMK